MIKITQKLIPIKTKRRPGIKLLGVKFIVCHDTGNNGSTSIQNVDWYIKSANYIEASAHTFIDDKEIIECVPLEEKAYHVRRIISKDNELYQGDAIDWSIGVELCYSTRSNIDNLKAYKNYCEYIAMLCQKYTLDPKTKLVGHYKLDPTRRTDPLNAFGHINKTWEQFVADISALIVSLDSLVTVQVPQSRLQRVLDFLKTV